MFMYVYVYVCQTVNASERAKVNYDNRSASDSQTDATDDEGAYTREFGLYLTTRPSDRQKTSYSSQQQAQTQ